jgi:hypothetical protein
LRLFNNLIASVLPLIDLASVPLGHGIASKLCAIRGLIFFDTKNAFLREVINKTVSNEASPIVSIDRLSAVKDEFGMSIILFARTDNNIFPVDNHENSVFVQCMHQLNSQQSSTLRQKERCFLVKFKGEHAEGEGDTLGIKNIFISIKVGPYRESITQMCYELQSKGVKNLFIPCPNQQLASDTIGVGENREKYIPNPSATSSENLKAFEFIGKLFGMAIRSQNPLSLDLPSIFWKPIVGLKPNRNDLKEIDYSTCESMERIENMTKETFDEYIFESFSTMLTDRQETILILY